MNVVAIDIGASGGTVYLGRLSSSTFKLEEVDRFENAPVEADGRYVWDLQALQEQMIEGIQAADQRADGIDAIGIDTWGLDFGLTRNGTVLRDPTSYRDPEATAAKNELFETVGKRRLFEATGITNWNTPNTLWQLYTLAREDPSLLERADELLMMPQLLSTLLGGRAAGEVTIASTTQMVDPDRQEWACDLLAELSLPTELLPDLESPGARLGPVNTEVAASLSTTPELVMPASHDTASAVAGLPLTDDAAFLSTGSWFLFGVERSDPLVTDAAFELSLSNELGADGTVRLLKNITGFFLLEECRNAWHDAGEPTAYGHLLRAAQSAEPMRSLVDPDAEEFGIEGSMPAKIRSYCRRTGQPVPAGQGEVVRCLLESLAAKTALVFDELGDVVEAPPKRIVLGGGGVRNELFCQLLADATGRSVQAGPVEATAIGNVLTQAIALDVVPDLETGRELVAEQFEPRTYEPAGTDKWGPAKERMGDLVATDD
ncbi:rhamnulokinase [Natronococcus sp. A-GB1]|uniref:rhamnulokinase n=1 Tax=Natronococcus sp. A-GB1 TaxID=3037648 RepID=UPI00241E350D|nr:rhamnulokinase family protein [Natronococcus sp. A-GB1]MDG5761953.1 rhamnulokinase [Natronococcus sp. A-GB1]